MNITAAMVNLAAGAASTFHCENPAADNQPDRADCVKTFAWSIIDINSRGGTDDCFTIVPRFRKGAFHVVVPGATRDAGAAAFNLRNAFYVYHATVTGPVALNGLYLPVPHAITTVYDTGDGTIGLGKLALDIGPFGTQTLDLSRTVTLQSFQVSDCYSHQTQGYHLLENGLLKGGTKIGGLPVQGGSRSTC